MPRSILSRASTENFTSFAAIFITPKISFTSSHRIQRDHSGWRISSSSLLAGGGGLDQHAHDVALFHDQVLGAVNLHLGPRPFAEQNAVAGFDVDWNELAAL